MARTASPALRALLHGVIDYAGGFPPASLSAVAVVENFRRYRSHEQSWMLRWLVVSAADVPRVPPEFDGMLAVLADADEPRAAALETKRVVPAARPVYCEVPLAELDAVKAAGQFAKLRTGGVTAAAIPTVETVAAFIAACAERRLPFKATAGLHHPVRAVQPLTYDAAPPRAVMHGFLNVLLAAAFAWHGAPELLAPILAETDPAAFRFDDGARWRDRALSVEQVAAARRDFAHAFGSCSFDEPVRDLQSLGLL